MCGYDFLRVTFGSSFWYGAHLNVHWLVVDYTIILLFYDRHILGTRFGAYTVAFY